MADKKALAALDDGLQTQAQVRQAEAELKELEDKLRSVEVELKDCELQLKTVETKKQNYEKRMYAGQGSPKELEGMVEEVAMLGRNQDKLETRVLELMEAAQEQQGLAKASRSRFDQLTAELAAKVEAYNKRSAELSEEISKATAERNAAANSVDEIWLRRYEGIRSRAGGIAVSRVDDGRCSACHVALTPFAIRELKQLEEPPLCENCGRMLLPPE